MAQRGLADRGADGGARRDGLLLRGVLAPPPFGAASGEDAVSAPEEVRSHWFPEGINDADPETRRRQVQRWVAGGPEVDRKITERFGEVLGQARRGELDHWADTARGRLALIVVLDQFSRNVYRG